MIRYTVLGRERPRDLRQRHTHTEKWSEMDDFFHQTYAPDPLSLSLSSFVDVETSDHDHRKSKKSTWEGDEVSPATDEPSSKLQEAGVGLSLEPNVAKKKFFATPGKLRLVSRE